jgi:hypothetical protein
MKTLTFQALCTKLCFAAEAPVPYLEPDSLGNTVLSITVDGIEIVLAHKPHRNSRDALLSVAFGPLPEENALAACHALMEINSLLLWNRACTFGRNREKAIVLQYAFPLQSSACELYHCILTVANVARSWRQTHFITEPGASLIAPLIAAIDCA